MPLDFRPTNVISQVGPGGFDGNSTIDPKPSFLDRLGQALQNYQSGGQISGYHFTPLDPLDDQNGGIEKADPGYSGSDVSTDDVGTEADHGSGESDAGAQQVLQNEGGFSLSKYMQENPGLSYEEYLQQAALHSDEYAEAYLNYLTERGELDRANQYTAEREDTAYQRLVQDLKAAGLNPAMMYGSTASTTTHPSQGYVKMSEGANSRSVANYSKLKELILNFQKFAFEQTYKTSNQMLGVLGGLFGGLLKILL